MSKAEFNRLTPVEQKAVIELASSQPAAFREKRKEIGDLPLFAQDGKRYLVKPAEQTSLF
jgi:hypothetical protein